MGEGFDKVTDMLVVGSGGAGMVGALVAKDAGLDVLIIEKNEFFGGSTARSGGGMWAPNSPAMLREGERDDPAELLAYLERIVGNSESVTRERLVAYVEQVPKMMAWLEDHSEHLHDGFFWIKGYSDYHPDKGGHPLGRGVWAKPIDKRLLGDDMKLLHPGVKRMSLPLGAWITSIELRKLLAVRWGGLGHKRIFLTLGWRILRARVLGERIGPSGQALATRLWLALRDAGVPVWLKTPMQSLICDDDGAVVGVEAQRDGKTIRIGARHGVLLVSGGFDHNMDMRREYQPEITNDWSLGTAGNTGDGIRAGVALGAATDLMDEAWWQPVMEMPDGTLVGLVAERQYPGQFVVNGAGERFTNESSPYVTFVHAQLEGHRTGVSHIPAWMVLDERAWKRNIICGHFPGSPLPKRWVDAGVAHTAPTLGALAEKIGVPPEALKQTAERFNGFARAGRDEDFHRGESVYDNYYGDPSYKNPNLGEVSQPPFYALALSPGDLGTKGGLVTDERGRVLRADRSPIERLYASGNTTSSVMGVDYPGPGGTLGPALTFAYLAALDIVAGATAETGAQARARA